MSNTLTTAMIFAAGRGERMRPLTDTRPKPLLEAGGKPLIVWQIEALARAGIETIVINHAWLGEQIEAALGDGSRWGVRLAYSAEGEALETAGGIAQALPLLERDGQPAVFAAVAGDVYSAFDYRTLAARAARMAKLDAPAMHLVMVPNPPFHPAGDFVLRDDGQLSLAGTPRATFGSIGLYDTRMFRDIKPGSHRALSPYFKATIEAGRASGELYEGIWENVGTPAQLGELDARLRAAE
ncbi:MAG: nucleotidyltransferase family protein [Burkholderia sp.]|jgi:MurNAc alpha-1-phosphate uridylyltransferase|uniref:N-acetylmuramate alpha-1-phosphate uridylyltransferase MurU n=1 Tax=Burkholderia TaxID=32008 RepID=UPI001CF250C4|nr:MULTISPECIES: nucleotidyltransferase family protein [Burkholderia]MCA3780340.1 nucleotidyltransferase family protein [Burkholderia sp.]MCA3792836.1 nucleotidyltransferase family protein [Burkholderia sp.]MCA3800288.1 nucleotidyltransferase family protein [Burkholderia sp.]MCA3807979.1 nucleotidyltransferase family protein [Burkholderia sp.]MCA3816921.1 nucleotidyltransferase family protein [Burkholderia sp.]